MLRILFLAFPLLFGAVCFAQSEVQAQAEGQATEAAKVWLQLLDEEKYDESWREAASSFRKSVDKGQWKKMAESARQPLGKLQDRRLDSAKFTNVLPGAPDGEYVIIQFQAKFANKASAIETLTPVKDTDGVWRVSGYFIR